MHTFRSTVFAATLLTAAMLSAAAAPSHAQTAPAGQQYVVAVSGMT